jgi:hypothetical protein
MKTVEESNIQAGKGWGLGQHRRKKMKARLIILLCLSQISGAMAEGEGDTVKG